MAGMEARRSEPEQVGGEKPGVLKAKGVGPANGHGE